MKSIGAISSLFFCIFVGENINAISLPAYNDKAKLNYTNSQSNEDTAISDNRKFALELFSSITGTKISIDDTRIIQMEQFLNQGKKDEAANVAVADKLFFNVRLATIARELSNREMTNQDRTNDFVAMFVGGVRDGMNARQLITENFYYRDNATGIKEFDIGAYEPIHYKQFDEAQYSIYDNSIKTSPQIFEDKLNGSGSGVQPAADRNAAGLITSRAFMEEHALGGTNRRIVEYTFKAFMCVEMEDWKDLSRPTTYIGKDVDRNAGGSSARFQQDCRGCHAQLDGFRSAFAHFDFNKRVRFFRPSIHQKISANDHVYPDGHPVINDNFVNNALGDLNMDRFGWDMSLGTSGSGPKEFATMIASSKGFSRCFVRRFFEKICRREPAPSEENVVRNLASQFESSYLITDLARIVALHPNCLPQ